MVAGGLPPPAGTDAAPGVGARSGGTQPLRVGLSSSPPRCVPHLARVARSGARRDHRGGDQASATAAGVGGVRRFKEKDIEGFTAVTYWWQDTPTRDEVEDALARRKRNEDVIRAILRACSADEDGRWYLTHALRRHSELLASDRWQRTVYRTREVLASIEEPIYEHVVPNAWFCRTLLADRSRWVAPSGQLEALLTLQVTCLVTRDEHRGLGKGFGWQRYHRPKKPEREIALYDCRSAPFKTVDLRELVFAQQEKLEHLGLAVQR